MSVLNSYLSGLTKRLISGGLYENNRKKTAIIITNIFNTPVKEMSFSDNVNLYTALKDSSTLAIKVTISSGIKVLPIIPEYV